MADVENPSNHREELINKLGSFKTISPERREFLKQIDDETLGIMMRCKNFTDFMSSVRSVYPNMTKEEFNEKYAPVQSFYVARQKQVTDIKEAARDRINSLFQFREADSFLKNKPTALMAIKVRDLRRGWLDPEKIVSAVKKNVDEQKKWVLDHEMGGCQLIFILDEGEWRLFDNRTGVEDEVVEETVPQEKLQEFWLVDNDRKALEALELH